MTVDVVARVREHLAASPVLGAYPELLDLVLKRVARIRFTGDLDAYLDAMQRVLDRVRTNELRAAVYQEPSEAAERCAKELLWLLHLRTKGIH